MAKSNVIKYRRTGFSIGSVLFVIILLYIVFVSVHFLRKEHITIYEVNEKQIYDDNTTIGIAIRKEEVYNAEKAGYVGYYNSNASKVSKGSTIYTIDPSGTYKDKLEGSGDSSKVSAQNISDIRSKIKSFNIDFDYSDYSTVYNFKYSVESSVLSLISDTMITQLQNSAGNAGDKAFSLYNANNTGIITYWTDGLENLDETSINEECFVEENYQKNTHKTSDSISVGDAVCKVVTDEKWNIIIKLDEKQKQKLEDKDTVRIRFMKDNLETTVPFTLFNVEDNDYANISLDKYMIRYIDDRYIKLELILNSAEGLKIPVSSVLEKNCYIIPADYLTKGGDSGKDMLVYEVTNKDGSKSAVNIDSFAYKDDEYVYVDALLLQPGTSICKPSSEERFSVSEIKAIKGVYNVNEGYCQFKHIEIIYENKEYCIVKKDTPYGLSVYDHIVVNPDIIDEDDIIY